jgi:hypothetical protein
MKMEAILRKNGAVLFGLKANDLTTSGMPT